VKAKCKGSTKKYPGKIERDNGDGTFDVKFDDGDRDKKVPKDAIEIVEKGDGKSRRSRSPSPKRDSERGSSRSGSSRGGGGPKEGDKVEARCKGSGKHYPGKIERDNGDGTFDVKFDDGDRDKNCPADHIKGGGGGGGGGDRSRSPDRGSSRGGGDVKLDVGTKVECRHGGGDKHYPGKIGRCRLNGTYDVLYDDGDKELGVKKEFIRPTGGGGGSSGGRDDDDRGSGGGGDKKYERGDKIEANFKGRGKYYPGKILRARANGTYDINFDDGEREMSVEAENIRSVGGGGDDEDRGGRGGKGGRGSGGKLEEGQKVEVDFKGRGKYYPGKISRCRLNGTYDIAYDDGEREMGVEKGMIKALGGGGRDDDSPRGGKGGGRGGKGGGSGGSKKLQEGDPCEAKHGGGSKWYKGTIMRCRLNGSYDIKYDDGDKEQGVKADLVRGMGGGEEEDFMVTKSSSRGRDDDEDRGGKGGKGGRGGEKLQEGDPCECRHGGGSKYFPGTLMRCRLICS
jgi:hypothetical protein